MPSPMQQVLPMSVSPLHPSPSSSLHLLADITILLPPSPLNGHHEQQKFLVAAAGFIPWGRTTVFDELYEVIREYWEKEFRVTYESNFDSDNWETQLEALGFQQPVINGTWEVLRKLRYIVDEILQDEPVSAIADTLLDSVFEFYSNYITASLHLEYSHSPKVQ
jgi:hypothetical protein